LVIIFCGIIVKSEVFFVDVGFFEGGVGFLRGGGIVFFSTGIGFKP
jgi:hypothetical protein